MDSKQLKTVPESLVMHLQQLETLDLSHNQLGDSSFPEAMKTLDCLVELRLSGNQLTKVPTCVRRLRNLSRLDLSHNLLDSSAGLEKLKKLQVRAGLSVCVCPHVCECEHVCARGFVCDFFFNVTARGFELTIEVTSFSVFFFNHSFNIISPKWGSTFHVIVSLQWRCL